MKLLGVVAVGLILTGVLAAIWFRVRTSEPTPSIAPLPQVRQTPITLEATQLEVAQQVLASQPADTDATTPTPEEKVAASSRPTKQAVDLAQLAELHLLVVDEANHAVAGASITL